MFNVNFNPWGTTAITTQQAINDQSAIFNNVFGSSPNLYPSSPTGAFIQELTNTEVNVNNTCIYITSHVYGLSTTQGVFLDGIGNLFGIKRTPATYTTVICNLLGSPFTVIPANSIVSDGTNQFISVPSITLNSSGNATVLYTARQSGQIDVPPNSVTTILTPIAGWSSITNANAGVSGSKIQNDTAYRYTVQYSQAINGRSFIESLYAVFRNFIAQDGSTTTDAYGINVPYIQGFYIYSNYTNSAVTLVTGKPTIPVGGIYITLHAPQYLNPSNPNYNDNLQYVAGIILNQISANTTNNIQSGANAYNVTYVNPIYAGIDPVVVNFDSPISEPIEISFSITLYSKQQNQSVLLLAIQQQILSQFYNGYSNGNITYEPAQMNVAINTADFIAGIVAIAGACTITAQNIQLVTSGTPATSLTLEIDKIATLALNNINITLS